MARSKMNLGPSVVDGEFEAVEPLREPTADAEGYYLDGEWLDALAAHPFSPREAETFMAEVFPRAVKLMWCPGDYTPYPATPQPKEAHPNG